MDWLQILLNVLTQAAFITILGAVLFVLNKVWKWFFNKFLKAKEE